MAVSDANIMQAARDNYNDTSAENEFKGEGQYHLLEDREAVRVERQIMFADVVPAIDKVRLEVAMLESAGIAGLDRAHFQSRAASMASFEAERTENPVEHAAEAKVSRADHVAALQKKDGPDRQTPPTQLGQQLAAALQGMSR